MSAYTKRAHVSAIHLSLRLTPNSPNLRFNCLGYALDLAAKVREDIWSLYSTDWRDKLTF